MNWLQTYAIARGVNATIGLLAVAALTVTGHRLAGRPDGGPGWSTARVAGIVVLAGILDVAGLISFATGLESAPTWMVGLASSFGPAITIVIAVGLLGERLRPIQWLGLAGILAGMIAIAIP